MEKITVTCPEEHTGIVMAHLMHQAPHAPRLIVTDLELKEGMQIIKMVVDEKANN